MFPAMLSSRAMDEPGYLRLLETGELEERVERLYALLAACTVCPRDCGNDRMAGVLASCASGLDPVVSAHTPHFGEEPTLVLEGRRCIYAAWPPSAVCRTCGMRREQGYAGPVPPR